MTLPIGSRIGPYDIRGVLGAGGMGEVYRGYDPRLQREVAIKILPEAFSRDADRSRRFEREARLLAALNHPHIAHVYGLEETDAGRALVLELVQGEDLQARLARGPLAITEALALAGQVADALAAAHDAGIVHRDLKPGNIVVRSDGAVKVLDFGLAKVFDAVAPSESGIDGGRETATSPATEMGVILGTPAYMAPEQARGQAVDRRADLWALGCVLYEMLTGRRPFSGPSSSDVIAQILTREPDWELLPPSVPAGARRVLLRTLEKDVRRRLRDAGDAALDLRELTVPLPVAVEARRPITRPIALGIAAALGGLAAAAVLVQRAPTRNTAAVLRTTVLPPAGQRLASTRRGVVVSPDGQQLAYAVSDGLRLRRFDAAESRLIPGTANGFNPAFSPDGRSIAIWTLEGVRVIDLATSAATLLRVPPVDLGGILGSLSWSEHGLLLSQGAGGVYLFAPGATDAHLLIPPSHDEAVSSAQMLPGGRHVLLTLVTSTAASPGGSTGRVVVQALNSTQQVEILKSGSDARYVPGYVVYAADGALHAVGFDAASLRTRGTPVAVIEGVRATNVVNAATHYSVSDTGVLAYVPGQSLPAAMALDLVKVSRQGVVTYLHLPPAPYESPRVSPDGTRVAMSTDDGTEAQVWIHDLAQPSSIRKLTLAGRNRLPIWSPDSRRVAYQASRDGKSGIFSQTADGSEASIPLTTAAPGTTHVPESWSPDGDDLLYAVVADGRHTLWRLSIATRRSEPFGSISSATPTAATFSPDGKWVAYNTLGAAGLHAVFVQPFPATGAVYQISRNDDGHHPVWSRTTKELFFIPGPGRVIALSVSAGPAFGFSPNGTTLPAAGLLGPGTLARNYDILADSAAFIGRQIAEDEESRRGAPPRIEIVTNWFEDLRRRVRP